MDIYNMTEAQKRDAYNQAADVGLWSGKEKEMEVKNLYLITQDENQDYDTYDAARLIHPCEPLDNEWDLRSWAEPKDVKVKLIGTATDNIKLGVVLASFNAG